MKFLKSFIIFVSILFFVLIAYVLSINFFEPKAFNFMVKNFTATTRGSDEVVIIVIDDKSIGKYRWPWKRELYCQMFDYFHRYSKTKLIVNDAILVTPDRENPQSDLNYFNCIRRIPNLVVGFDMSFRQNPLCTKEYANKFDEKFGIDIVDKRTKKVGSYYQSLLMFPEGYFDAIKMVGSVKTPVSRDSFLRSIPYVISYKDKLYPSLALRAFSYLNENEGYIVTDRYIIGQKSGVHIPRNNDNGGFYTFIRFHKRYSHLSNYSHKIYSAIDIMESYEQLQRGEKPIIDPAKFDGKIVFIGANVKAAATGLSDIQRTPVSNEHSGVDVQATTLDNLINNNFMSVVTPLQNLLITFLIIGLTYFFIRKFSLFASISLTLFIAFIYIFICSSCFARGVAINIITPISLELITMIFAYSHRYIIENQNKTKIQNAMGKYISEDIMKSVVQNIDNIELGGKKANVTVLFSDIRGFTTMSEKLSADEVSDILNEYFTEMEPIVTKHHGVINKFIGDAIMVIFGEPIQDENHAVNAVRCAYEMLKKVDELQQKWLDEGKPKIEIGVGINTGEVFVGNIGSEKRMEYTVIGDNVNLASRIESYNKTYKTNFLISSSTYACVKNIVDVIKISNVTIRGKSKKSDLYEVISLIG